MKKGKTGNENCEVQNSVFIDNSFVEPFAAAADAQESGGLSISFIPSGTSSVDYKVFLKNCSFSQHKSFGSSPIVACYVICEFSDCHVFDNQFSNDGGVFCGLSVYHSQNENKIVLKTCTFDNNICHGPLFRLTNFWDQVVFQGCSIKRCTVIGNGVLFQIVSCSYQRDGNDALTFDGCSFADCQNTGLGLLQLKLKSGTQVTPDLIRVGIKNCRFERLYSTALSDAAAAWINCRMPIYFTQCNFTYCQTVGGPLFSVDQSQVPSKKLFQCTQCHFYFNKAQGSSLFVITFDKGTFNKCVFGNELDVNDSPLIAIASGTFTDCCFRDLGSSQVTKPMYINVTSGTAQLGSSVFDKAQDKSVTGQSNGGTFGSENCQVDPPTPEPTPSETGSESSDIEIQSSYTEGTEESDEGGNPDSGEKKGDDNIGGLIAGIIIGILLLIAVILLLLFFLVWRRRKTEQSDKDDEQELDEEVPSTQSQISVTQDWDTDRNPLFASELSDKAFLNEFEESVYPTRI